MPSGAAFFDSDADGYGDLFLVNATRVDGPPPEATNRLYRNTASQAAGGERRVFRDVTDEAGLRRRGWGMGCAAADYDNDGGVDLYVTYWGPNVLYRNQGSGTFADVTARAGVGDPGWGASAGFADLDADGFVDLFVTNYLEFDLDDPPGGGQPCTGWKGLAVYCGPMGMVPQANVLYRNDRRGAFLDVSEPTGISRLKLPSLGVVFGDFDGDGDVDIYLANDSEPNTLYRNDGDWKFAEIATLAGVAYSEDGRAQAGMGVAAGDYDNDADLDLFVTNFSDDVNTLYRNLGANRFEDATASAGLDGAVRPFLGWSTGFLDGDNDGWLDLLVANGHIYPQVDQYPSGIRYAQRLLYYGNREGRFEEASPARTGLTQPRVSRGAAFGDYDNDGDQDVLVINLNDRPTLLENRMGSRNNWVGLELRGVASNRDGIGARVRLTAGGRVQTREVTRTYGYLSQHDPRVLFGIGPQERVEGVEIRWPSGLVQTLHQVPLRQYLVVREGDDGVLAAYQGVSAPLPSAMAEPAPVIAAPPDRGPPKSRGTEAVDAGVQLYREGRYEEALAELRSAVAGDGAGDTRAHYALAVVLYAGLGRPAEAAQALERAQALDSTSAEVLELLGTVYLSLDEADRAAAVLGHAAAVDASRWQSRNLLGLAHLRRGDLAAAEGAFGEAIYRAAWEPHPHLNLARIHQRLGRPSASAWEHRAFEKLRRLQDEVEWYEGKVAQESASPRYRVLLGRCYLMQGRHAASMDQFGAALGLDPGYGLAHYGMGAAYHLQGQLDSAIDAYQRALAADSSLVLALNDLGRAYQQAGHLRQASAAYARAVGKRPDLATAGANLAEVEAVMAAAARLSEAPARQAVSPRAASGREQVFSP